MYLDKVEHGEESEVDSNRSQVTGVAMVGTVIDWARSCWVEMSRDSDGGRLN